MEGGREGTTREGMSVCRARDLQIFGASARPPEGLGILPKKAGPKGEKEGDFTNK